MFTSSERTMTRIHCREQGLSYISRSQEISRTNLQTFYPQLANNSTKFTAIISSDLILAFLFVSGSSYAYDYERYLIAKMYSTGSRLDSFSRTYKYMKIVFDRTEGSKSTYSGFVAGYIQYSK